MPSIINREIKTTQISETNLLKKNISNYRVFGGIIWCLETTNLKNFTKQVKRKHILQDNHN